MKKHIKGEQEHIIYLLDNYLISKHLNNIIFKYNL